MNNSKSTKFFNMIDQINQQQNTKSVEWFLDDYARENNLSSEQLKSQVKSLKEWFKKITISYLIISLIIVLFLVVIVALLIVANTNPNSGIDQNILFYVLIFGFIILTLAHINIFNIVVTKKYNRSEIFRYVFLKKMIRLREWNYHILKIHKTLSSLLIKIC